MSESHSSHPQFNETAHGVPELEGTATASQAPHNATESEPEPAAGGETQDKSDAAQARELANRVAELEQQLAESQAVMQAQRQRLEGTESLLEQRDRELESTQAIASQLSQELASARQTVEQQNASLQSLSQRLSDSQARTAELERECALIRQECNEQSFQVSQQAGQLRDLHRRLKQQRRYTRQFKLALHQCLEASAKTGFGTGTRSRPQALPAQPIPPWSEAREAPASASSAAADAEAATTVEAHAQPTAEAPEATDAPQPESAAVPQPDWPAPAIAAAGSAQPRSADAIDLPGFLGHSAR